MARPQEPSLFERHQRVRENAMVSGISNVHCQCVAGAPCSATRIKYSNQYVGLYSNLSILFLSFSYLHLIYSLLSIYDLNKVN